MICEISRTFRILDQNASSDVYQVATQTTGATFQINDSDIYVPVVRKYKARI